MDILVLLIPVSLVFLALAVWLFIWSVNNKQFEDLEKHGLEVLFDDEASDKSTESKPK